MENKTVLVGTFSLWAGGGRTAITGMIDPLVYYFGPRTKELTIIDGTHPGGSTTRTYVEQYSKNKKTDRQILTISKILSPLLKRQNSNATQVFFKVRDLFSVWEWAIRSGKTYDLFIGLESVYTLAGIVLRWFGKVKTVVYYVSDYSPQRYENNILNTIYLRLDRYCCIHADAIWDVSPAIMDARIQAGFTKLPATLHIQVPNALYPDQITIQPFNKTIPYSLVFAGTLGPENGPQIAVNALPAVLKQFPQATLHIFGGNDEFEKPLRGLVEKNKLTNHVVFHGFISDQQKLSKEISRYRLALAPYTAIPGSPRWYADATKIRLYMGAGLPVITTHVPPLGKQIEKAQAGIVVKDSSIEFANAITRLFQHPSEYKALRENTISFAKDNTWDNTYRKAMDQMDRFSV